MWTSFKQTINKNGCNWGKNTQSLSLTHTYGHRDNTPDSGTIRSKLSKQNNLSIAWAERQGRWCICVCEYFYVCACACVYMNECYLFMRICEFTNIIFGYFKFHFGCLNIHYNFDRRCNEHFPFSKPIWIIQVSKLQNSLNCNEKLQTIWLFSAIVMPV